MTLGKALPGPEQFDVRGRELQPGGAMDDHHIVLRTQSGRTACELADAKQLLVRLTSVTVGIINLSRTIMGVGVFQEVWVM